jgi:nucleotide-binding universal stress UspA family protein
MFNSIVVPLDRTSFAEQALPLALAVARQANARLDLVEVHHLYALEDRRAAWVPYEPERDAELRQRERLYLDATAKWMTAVAPVSITASVLPGLAVLPESVAEHILEQARMREADLIVMATHGRGPWGRLGFGSVADVLVRRAHVPVLLWRPGMILESFLDNILIPLDGSALAEKALEPALDMARLMQANCMLLRVVAAPSSFADNGSGGPHEEVQAAQYLERIAGIVRGQGLSVRTRVVVARHPAEGILEEAAAQASNLIVLATHGRGGARRLLLGSVTDKLVRTAAAPVLVYSPQTRPVEASQR